MQFFPSLSLFADSYDAFILDLWGVVHDGSHLYPGAKACLEALRSRGKKIIFLSNAPRRAKHVEAKLHELGIHKELYDHVLSSGEVAFRFLHNPDHLGLKPRYFYFGPEKDADLLAGAPYERVDTLDDADFILNVDTEYQGQPISEMEPYLNHANHLQLPMVCVNPDIEVVKQDGTHMWCAGAIARAYEDRGGEVSYFGKPFAAVYETALSLFGDVQKKLILAVGDNLDTDILGGNRMAIDTALVTGGILKREMPVVDPFRLRQMAEEKKAHPTFVVPAFSWENPQTQTA